MSHHFDCLVDTTEMAREVSSVNKHVDATTTAVVGMQTAVIRAQQEGADNVCKKVNQGFYAMIHSQISQKMATLQSKVDAQLMRLNQQRKQLTAIRQRMERDYQMISARYNKIFTSLNRNLRQRVTELDRPVLQLATTEADQITNRGNQLVAAVPVGQSESVKTSQNVASSNLKYRAAGAIEAINSFIADSNQLNNITEKILLARHIDSDRLPLELPVAVMESNFDSSGNTQSQVFVSEAAISKEAKSAIETRVSAASREGVFEWKDGSEVNPEVANYFQRMVADSRLDARRQETIRRLFGASKYETL
ncbi:MAG: hypothetical protein K2N05_12155 [Muribaculaceae bacterium]|nr:hypothetical protein [Muribaculaceae bacterium]